MKKLLALCVLLSMCLCSAAFAEEKLVIYTTVSKGVVSELVPMFEKETGIKVEIVRAGVGELIKRIQSEKDNPLADVLWGSALASLQAAGEPYFEHYVSANNDAMVDRYKNVEGWVTRHSLAVRCLLVNKNLIGDIPVTGYADLLNPALKGKISHVDPSASSSGYGHLCNMLFAMGGNDLDKGWEYVDKFCANLGNKLLNSSSAVWKGVNDGEYTVGLTYEEVALQSVKSGAPVKIDQLFGAGLVIDDVFQIVVGDGVAQVVDLFRAQGRTVLFAQKGAVDGVRIRVTAQLAQFGVAHGLHVARVGPPVGADARDQRLVHGVPDADGVDQRAVHIEDDRLFAGKHAESLPSK